MQYSGRGFEKSKQCLGLERLGVGRVFRVGNRLGLQFISLWFKFMMVGVYVEFRVWVQIFLKIVYFQFLVKFLDLNIYYVVELYERVGRIQWGEGSLGGEFGGLEIY